MGVYMQNVIYSYLIPAGKEDPELELHVWGANDPAVPAWQRTLARIIFHVLNTFVAKVRV
jgi:hypothetical protein